MKINFKPGTPEHKKKGLRKAIKAAHSPEANRKRIASYRATMKQLKQQKMNGGGRNEQQVIPLDLIPGERAPHIAYSDTPGSTRDKSKDERLQLAKALVATVFKLVG